MELSLILMVWNTSHLLRRTLTTLRNQTISRPWELIIVDDNSEDDVWQTLLDYAPGLPVQYLRLEHDMGMRGNTISLNTGIAKAVGRVVMWSTPEVMLPPGCLDAMCDAHDGSARWVTVPSHGLTAELQLKIDTVDWRSDIHNIKKLVEGLSEDDWSSVWFYYNFYVEGRPSRNKKKNYSNNQTVSVNRQVWNNTVKSFPRFLDYGSDDPWVSRERKKHSYKDVTLWDQEAYHQWHASTDYWMALGKAPNWNKHGRSIKNLTNDPLVPEGGTAKIWDGGSNPQMDSDEIARSLTQGNCVRATGFIAKEHKR